jgi:N-ethylmaleimide reductase
MDDNKLFDSFDLKGLQLKNRIVMAPMTRIRSNNPGNTPTALTAEYYGQRATAGLIITEGTFISAEAVGAIGVPGIYTKEQVEGWKLVTQAVHEKEGKIFAQLWHVGRLSHPDVLGGELPLAPSALNPFDKAVTPNGVKDTVIAREMTQEDIKKTINDFKQAAINAMEAGFDGVEIHGANGYLLHQFFNLYSNKRHDQYGGSLKNRARILFDILDKLSSSINIRRVGVRLNPSLHGIQGMKLDEESAAVHDYIVTKLNDYDLAYLHLTEPYTDVSENPFAIQQVAKHYRKIYRGVLIINKGFTKSTASQVLNDGYADLVSFAKLYIANPDLVERFKIDAPLNELDSNTIYTPGEKGYTDYPKMCIN